MNIRLSFLITVVAVALGGCGGGGGGGSGDGSPPPPAGNRAPTASFTATPTSGSAPVTVQFDGSASVDPDGSITTYAWDFGDGVTSSGAAATVSHQYLQNGSFTAQLTVTDNGGAHTWAERTINLGAAGAGVWLGAYETSLAGETLLNATIERTAATLGGTYVDDLGREGTLAGAIVGEDVSLQLTSTTPGCSSAFVGEGVLSPDVIEGTDTLFFFFAGTDCDGAETDGIALLVLQQSDVLAWGQREPTGLTERNGELFWTDNGPRPLKKVDTSSGVVTPLAERLGPVTSLALSGTRIVWTHGIGDLGTNCTGPYLVRALGVSNADGSNVRTLATGDFCSGMDSLARVLADDTYAYWVKTTLEGFDVIERVALAGGSPETLATPGTGFGSMAIDASHVYWSEVIPGETTKILRCPVAGCGVLSPETVLSTDDTVTLWSNIALIGDDLVFGIQRLGQFGQEISRMPKAGGAIIDIAHADGQVLRVLADANTVFYLSGNALRSVPLGGGAVSTIVPGFFYLQDIALGGSRVYWTDASFAGGFADGIYFADKSGGPAGTLATTRYPASLQVDGDGNVIFADGTPSGLEATGLYRATAAGAVSNLVMGLGGASALAVDDQHVYAPQGFTIKRVGIDGGSAGLVARTGFYPVGIDVDDAYVYWGEDPQNIVLRAPFDQSAPPALVGAGNRGRAVQVVVRGGYAYWLGDPDTLWRAPAIGGAVQTLASDLQYATNILVDDQFVYVMEADGNRLSRLPLAGGARTTVTSTDQFFGWYALAQDAASIYWASPNGLFRVPKSGGVSAKYAEPFITDQFAPDTIAVDGQYLYWTEGALGAIKRRPK